MHVVTQSGDDLAAPPPVVPSDAPVSLVPTTAAPVSSAPAPKRTTTSPAETLTLDVALGRVQTAIEKGEESGDIRPDVAQDFRNILGQLAVQDDPDIRRQVELLRKKVRQRLSEGGLTAGQATILQNRLTDLGRARA